jgi:acetyltransferase-like isoleucine patch superfamily enzyme
MVLRPLRPYDPAADAVGLYRQWRGQIRERLADPGCDRNELCFEALRDIYFPGLPRDLDPADLSLAARATLANLDPRNATLEPEYYHEIDDQLYYPRKPLIWLWQMFDRSPLGGNIHLGVRFRRMLAPYVFKSVGEDFKCFHFVEVSFGYNLEVGDNVVVHRNVLLDDRGGIKIGDNVSISDHASIFSHTHSIDDISDVANIPTILDDHVRITFGATVLAGVHVGVQGMVGARALATKRVRPYHVNVGIPAKSVRVKSIAPPEVQQDKHRDAASDG